MKRFHPSFYFDTVILIFCHFVPYIYFTILLPLVVVIMTIFFLLSFDKLISKKLQNYVKELS